jgi:hypothetical protein
MGFFCPMRPGVKINPPAPVRLTLESRRQAISTQAGAMHANLPDKASTNSEPRARIDPGFALL